MILPVPCHVHTLNVAQLCGSLLSHQTPGERESHRESGTLDADHGFNGSPAADCSPHQRVQRLALVASIAATVLKDVAAADWFLGGQFIWYYSTGSNSLLYFFYIISIMSSDIYFYVIHLDLVDCFGWSSCWFLGLCNQSPWHLVSLRPLSRPLAAAVSSTGARQPLE